MKTYTKRELALLYFPDAEPRVATNHLMRWVNRCPELISRLLSHNYSPTAKLLTPKQAALIMEYLGEP